LRINFNERVFFVGLLVKVGELLEGLSLREMQCNIAYCSHYCRQFLALLEPLTLGELAQIRCGNTCEHVSYVQFARQFIIAEI
jgi:hypothetical protein